ncbi:MAG TPA: plastocyanin/azurin family copper-binding protein [Solirubrobacteraceae bacterium]|jgi:plastocyanin
MAGLRPSASSAALILLAVLCGCGGGGGGGASSDTTAGSAATHTEKAITSSGIKAQTTPKFGAPASTAPVRSGLIQVAYRNIAIAPDTIRAKVGSTVQWTSYDAVEHNVTSEGGPQAFRSKDFGEGGTFRVHLTKAGLIHYECTNHPASMNGSIEVVG